MHSFFGLIFQKVCIGPITCSNSNALVYSILSKEQIYYGITHTSSTYTRTHHFNMYIFGLLYVTLLYLDPITFPEFSWQVFFCNVLKAEAA
jgi:hypothetical protein